MSTTPARLFRTVAIAEAVTWTGLLVGMFLKYVTETTELGVRVFGMLHGVVFVAYVVTTVVVWVDRRWSAGRGLLALVAAVPPPQDLRQRVLSAAATGSRPIQSPPDGPRR